jgi:hypothetical protein
MLAAACQTAPLHSTGCRTSEEIEAAFQKLQEEMEESIRSRMDDTRRKLFERFDEDVHQRLRIKLADAKAQLDRVGQRFWSLTRYILGDSARFDDDALAFDLHRPSWPNIAAGRYHLISKSQPEPGHDRSEDQGRYLYRLSHPLGENVVSNGKALATPIAEIVFDVTNHPSRVHVVEALRRETRQAVALEQQHGIQQKLQTLERQQRRQRQEIFTVEDQIMEKRDSLIDQLERRLAQRTETESLFTIRWGVI